MLYALLTAAALGGTGFSAPRSGWWVDVGGGVALSAPPAAVRPAADASVGVWFGPYDADYALGRYTGVGLDVQAGDRAVLVEVRRGVDLIAAGAHGFVAAGPVFDGESAALIEVGGAVNARLRPTGRFVGWQLGARAGAAVGGEPALIAAITLGVEFASPWRAAR